MIAALIRTVFAQPDGDTARTQLRVVVDQLTPYAPTVAERLQAMEADVLAYTAFPTAHWSKIWSNNPIERLNRELKRRTDVVGIFPDKASVIRLVGALLVEINDEMIAAERRYIAAASVAELTDSTAELALPAAPRTRPTAPGERTRSPTPRDGTRSSAGARRGSRATTLGRNVPPGSVVDACQRLPAIVGRCSRPGPEATDGRGGDRGLVPRR
jgi:putative transposase